MMTEKTARFRTDKPSGLRGAYSFCGGFGLTKGDYLLRNFMFSQDCIVRRTVREGRFSTVEALDF